MTEPRLTLLWRLFYQKFPYISPFYLGIFKDGDDLVLCRYACWQGKHGQWELLPVIGRGSTLEAALEDAWGDWEPGEKERIT